MHTVAFLLAVSAVSLTAATYENSLNARNTGGETALIKAARLRNAKAVRALAAIDGIDATVQDARGFTALHWAAGYGDIDSVWTILSLCTESEVDTANADGDTPLMLASRENRSAVAIRLLDHTERLRTNLRDASNNSIVHWAAINDDYELINRLLRYGKWVAPFFVGFSMRGDGGKTALMMAAEKCHESAVGALLTAAREWGGLHLSDDNGNTALMAAVRCYDGSTFNMIMSEAFGYTPSDDNDSGEDDAD